MSGSDDATAAAELFPEADKTPGGGAWVAETDRWATLALAEGTATAVVGIVRLIELLPIVPREVKPCC